MAGWCIRWHVNYSAFKRGLSWLEVSGGMMTVWWSGRLPLGKRCGDGGGGGVGGGHMCTNAR